MFVLYSLLIEIMQQPADGSIFFYQFGNSNWQKDWTVTKANNYSGTWNVERALPPLGMEDEKLLFMKDGPKYFGISHHFKDPINVSADDFVFQYEIRRQDSHDCSGGYAKLFSTENYHPNNVTNETKYSIMFGPDKCSNTNKVHFIYRHKSYTSDEYIEHHLRSAPETKTDKLNHLYTLIIRKNRTYSILIDGDESRSGNILTDFDPPISQPKEIPDPQDRKPDNWPERVIDDPNDTKPADWDESQPEYIPDPRDYMPYDWLVNASFYIPDPNATKPDTWDEEIMGEWEAPPILNPNCTTGKCGEWTPNLIKNDLYRGKWRPRQIDNPEYKGEWYPKMIPNPAYTEPPEEFSLMPVAAVGYELWVVDKMVGINNILMTTNITAVKEWNAGHFVPKHREQLANQEEFSSGSRPDEVRVESIFDILFEGLPDFRQMYRNAVESQPVVIHTTLALAICVPSISILLAIIEELGLVDSIRRITKQKKNKKR